MDTKPAKLFKVGGYLLDPTGRLDANMIYFTWSCRKSDSREKWILRDICPYKTISKRKFSNRLVSRILF